MFTGIVQAVGQIISLEGELLVVQSSERAWEDPVKIGESISVSGCCLTVVQTGARVAFQLSEETKQRTTFGKLGAGSPVNIERALRPTDRMGGHIVQGHVDGMGVVLSIAPGETEHVFRFAVPEGFDRYLVDKASIAVDGISLTIVRPSAGAFSAFIVPHTLQHTNMRDMGADQNVNMEFDILFKYMEKIVSR